MPFEANHIFVLHDGTQVPVAVELRGDYVAYEADGTSWYTVAGKNDVWWTCNERNVNTIKRVLPLNEPLPPQADTPAKDFKVLLDARLLTESYFPDTVDIKCARCDYQWSRGRRDGRAATIGDRTEAAVHFRNEHGGKAT